MHSHISTPGFWSSVGLLLKMRGWVIVNNIRRARLSRKILYVFLCLFLIALVVGITYLTSLVLGFLNSSELQRFIDDQPGFSEIPKLIEDIPGLLTTGMFILLTLTSFGVLLQALYLSKDMDFLLSAPVPMRAVFFVKLLQAILPNFGLIVLFALPILFGMGAVFHYSFLYYPMVLVIMVAIALAAGGLASMMVILVVRIFPARRVAEILGFLGAIFSILCSQSGQLARFNEFDNGQINQVVSLYAQTNTRWIPTFWAGRGLVELGRGSWLSSVTTLGVILFIACGIFFLSLVTAERLYFSGWASIQGVSLKKKPRKIRPTNVPIDADLSVRKRPFSLIRIDLFSKVIPTPIQAIVLKDTLVIKRDLRNLSQLITPLILGIIYAFLLLRSGEDVFTGSGNAPIIVLEGLRYLSVFGNVFISLFVSWSLLSRLAGMAFSMEGRNYWLLKSSPIKSSQLLTAKFFLAYIPTLLLSAIFLVLISILETNSLKLLPFTLPVIAFIIAGNCGINLAFGAAGARLDWQDPRHMQRTWSGCLGALFSAMYLPLSMLIFMGPMVLASVLGYPTLIGQVIGLFLGSVVCLLAAIIPPYLVQNRINNLGDLS